MRRGRGWRRRLLRLLRRLLLLLRLLRRLLLLWRLLRRLLMLLLLLLLRRREGRLLNPGPLPKRVQDVLHVSETRRALRMNEMRPSATARVVRPSDGPSAVVGYSRAGERLPEGCQPRAVRQVGLRRRSGAVDDRVFHSSTPEMRSNNNEGSMFGLFYAIGFRLRIIKPMRCRSSY